MNCTKNELLILRTIRWAQTIEIDVKPDEFRGRRATLVSDPEPNQPVFLRKNILIPTCALQGPSVSRHASSLIKCTDASLLVLGERCPATALETSERQSDGCRESEASRS